MSAVARTSRLRALIAIAVVIALVAAVRLISRPAPDADSAAPVSGVAASERAQSMEAREFAGHERDVESDRASVATAADARSGPVRDASAARGLAVVARWQTDGSPAAGITLRASPARASDAGGTTLVETRRAQTDEQGRLEFASLGAGAWRISSAFGGEVIAVVDSDTECTLEVPGRAVALRGRVVDETGRGVPRATLWLSAAWGAQREPIGTPTDADGAFDIRCARAGQSIGASADGHVSSAAQSIPEPSGAGVDFLIVLTRGGCEVEGVVTDESLSAVPFAEVEIRAGGPPRADVLERADPLGAQPVSYGEPRMTTCDQRGVFRVAGLEPGGAEVRARAPGHAAAVRAAELRTGAPNRVELQLAHERVVEGVVRWSNGAAAARARVSHVAGSHFGSRSVVAAADGGYRLDSLPRGPLSLCAVAEGSCEVRTTLAGELDIERWDPLLETGRALNGRVHDAHGTPLEGWGVQIAPCEGEPGEIVFGETSASGEFRVPCVRAARVDVALFEDPGVAIPTVVEHGIPTDRDPLLFVVRDEQRRNSFLRARVEPRPGEAPTACRLRARKLDPPGAGTASDVSVGADGWAAIGPLQAGRYEVYVGVSDGIAQRVGAVDLRVAEVHELGVLSLAEPGDLRVSLIAQGMSSRRALLSIRYRDSTALAATRELDALRDGLVVLVPGLPPGSYDVELSGDGVAGAGQAVEIEPGREASIAIRAVP